MSKALDKVSILVQDLERCYALLEHLLVDFAFDKHTDAEIRTNMVNIYGHAEIIRLLGLPKRSGE